MAVNLNKIKNLPLQWQIVIAAVPSVVIVILFVFLIFLPKNKEIGNYRTKIKKLDIEIANSEAKIRRLDTLIMENALLKKKLARLKEQLPEEKEVSVLLKQISELGLMSGLEILLWKPEAKKMDPGGLYIEIPVKVEVLAEYHKLGVFLSHISRLPRLVNISDMKLSTIKQKDRENLGIINANFIARTFASIGEEDAKGADTGKSQ
jgi:type IV pilus assembly protein PilO